MKLMIVTEQRRLLISCREHEFPIERGFFGRLQHQSTIRDDFRNFPRLMEFHVRKAMQEHWDENWRPETSTISSGSIAQLCNEHKFSTARQKTIFKKRKH